MTFQTRVTIILVAITLLWEIGAAASCAGKHSTATGITTNTGASVAPSNSSESREEKSGEVGSREDSVWGGQHVRLTIKLKTAEIEFDCAHGEIIEPFKTDAQGRFDLPGTYVREGGPQRSDSESAEPARYSGKIAGDTMTLVLTLKDSDQKPEEFSLTRGNQGRLRKCK